MVALALKQLKLTRAALGFIALLLLVCAVGTWLATGQPYCQSANDREECPLEYDAGQVRQLIAVGILAALACAAALATMVVHRRARQAGGERLRVLGWQRADKLLAAAFVLASIALVSALLLREEESSTWEFMGIAGLVVSGAAGVLAFASLFVRPSSGIVQRWLVVPALVLAGLAMMYNWVIWLFSGLE